MKKILITGGCGYIGSAIYNKLKNKYIVDTVDLEWFGNYTNPNNIKKDFDELSQEFLNNYDVVILLAGHSSVKMCEMDHYSTFNNNIRNFVNLVEKCRITTTKLIYASSSSVYGNTGGLIASETDSAYECHNNYDLSKQFIDSYMQNSQYHGESVLREWWGLRFGTVNGSSCNFRTDLMVNAMTTAAKDGIINISNKHIHRAILGIDDLCRAVETIVLQGTADNSGIYNLNSFNSTVESISTVVADITGVSVRDHGLVGKPYDFAISNRKFTDTFNFKFTDTVESITHNIIAHSEQMNFTNRNNGVGYE